MALEPITRQEKIIAGQDLTPITRMEKFLKDFGGSGGGGGVQVVTFTGENPAALTSSHTGAEINAMALKGAVVANIKVSGMEMNAAYFGCSQIVGEGFSVSIGACFTVGFADTSTGKASYGAMYFYVEPETKKVSLKQVSFT